MTDKNEFDIKNVDNPFEKDILLFLNENGKCVYGEIIKELKISVRKGQEAIFSLIKKGLIKHKHKSSYIELNVKLRV